MIKIKLFSLLFYIRALSWDILSKHNFLLFKSFSSVFFVLFTVCKRGNGIELICLNGKIDSVSSLLTGESSKCIRNGVRPLEKL